MVKFIQDDICNIVAIARIMEVHYLYATPNLERQRERRAAGVEKNGSVTVNGKMLEMPGLVHWHL